MSISQRIDTQRSHILYDGKVRLDFDPIKHRYKINGEYAYGVTTALSIIAKPQLIWWSAKMASEHVKERLEPGVALDELEIQDLVEGARMAHNRKKDKAADQGSYIHNFIEEWVHAEMRRSNATN